ncbi:FimV/HubP family polar landmark protein [Gilvimarinus polysaccharolyticus]|uniref:FimV/HubP family polar landmark protein n=1 Tax=Gilvimarinus polysaccharolyticus TaxID=863921 RepID=UPI0006734AFA|nr:FimV/HubP family polar landmark protein [Gilvimarinus polysaccharolyticus]
MHLRKLVILLGVLSLLVSRSVLALGLGDISLNSSLNQPLDAHISLRDLGDLSADQIIIKLGTQEDFEKVGLERSFFYTQLRFNVIADGPNGPFVAVTSRDPVREPYLSFVVDMRWTSGRVMREYTLLLDLPTFSGERAAPVQGSVTTIESKSRPAKSEPVRQRDDSGAVSGDATRGDVYGPVKANDTLWEIARDHRPGNASIHQTMLAIQKANPEAFIRNNINLMRKGQVLRIPSENEVRELNNRQAISQVAEQNREWSGNAMGAQLDGSGRNRANTGSPTEVSGRLRLASGSDRSEESSRNAGAGDTGSAQLTRELTDTKDELARTRGENSELRSRVGDLEDQIETMERLLAVSNDQMRALEVAAQQDGVDAQDGVSAVAEADAEAQSGSVESSAVVESAAEAEEAVAAVEPAPVEPEVQEPVRNTSKVIRRAPEPTLMDKLMDNLLWIVLALVLIVVVIVVVLRKRASNDDDGDDFSPDDYDDPIAFDEDDDQFQADHSDGEAEHGELDEALFDEADVAAHESVEAETGDVVGEADIYIALGKYEQAEEMLLSGLEREPNSMPINLKLLEVYGESNNLESFDARLTSIVEQNDESSVARAYSLRTQHFPGAVEFVAPAGAALSPAQGDALDDGQAFDLDLEDAPSADTALDDDFDFDLSDDLDEMDDVSSVSDEVELDESTTSYDLSFDLEEDDSTDESLLEFNLDDDDTAVAEPEAEELTGMADDQQDSLMLDDLEFSLDDDEDSVGVVAEPEVSQSSSVDELDDLDFDLGSGGEAEDADADAALLDETPLLDEDFSFDAPLDLEADIPASEDVAAELAQSVEEQVPTLDLADDDADDFDLDKAMDDFDLASMDEDLAGLDAASEPAAGETAVESGMFDDDDDFEQALSGLDTDVADQATAELDALSEQGGDADSEDEDLDFLADSDEVTTKLDLARAYIDMGDLDGARDILSEVAEEGDEAQKAEALSLLDKARG